MYGAAALAQLLLGQTLFAEAVLVSLAFALAAVLTALAVKELTGSRVLAVLAAVLEVAIVPRTYGYPKLLVYAAAFFLLQRFVTRPTTGRLFALAVCIVAGFLFRHDHGIYLGVAGVLAAWLAGPPLPWAARLRRSALLVGFVVLLAVPYLVYVQVNGGVWAYLQTGLEFRAAELRRQELAWPASFEEPFQALMIYRYWAIPALAALLLLLRRHREDSGSTVARLVPILVVAFLVNWTFLRSPFHTRLPDAIVPAVVVGSWLMAYAWRARHRWIWGPLSALLLVAVAASVLSVGRIGEELDRTGLLDEGISWRETLSSTRSALKARHAEGQLPSRAAVALVPFYAYVDRCTRPEHRLLAVGNIAEVPVFARRAFAGRHARVSGRLLRLRGVPATGAGAAGAAGRAPGPDTRGVLRRQFRAGISAAGGLRERPLRAAGHIRRRRRHQHPGSVRHHADRVGARSRNGLALFQVTPPARSAGKQTLD